ncbi:MAG: nucleotidyltransferase [Bacilli bacterium]|nr:nucleotidyltransferase [Bacilli bacterium]
MELLIMAAGMGSRFGGLKQIAPMGPNDEFIIDYSVYDAIASGFSKVIFIIKEENYDVFKETIGARVEPHIPVEYVFQKMDNIPEFVNIPEERVKPWGTAQAIYCAKDAISEPFVVINADDFYGRDAFRVAKEFLDNSEEKEYATVGYEAIKTMTENGSVKRGVIATKDGHLESITESSIIKEGDKVACTPLNGSEVFYIENEALVSMNMLVFDPSIFNYLEEKMPVFFENNKDNLDKCEFLIPDVLDAANKEGYAKVKVLHTEATWYGVTYQEDTDMVRSSIKKLVEDGEYPNNLWG